MRDSVWSNRVEKLVGMTQAGYADASVDRPVFNPWADIDFLDLDEDASRQRCDRLTHHFAEYHPKLLLIGEAPGYQGCRFSGVPFTNEALICAGRIPRIPATPFTAREKPWSEPSATIVWETLHVLGVADQTIMWNAFPWHPHKPGEPHSNRTPTTTEVRGGLHILSEVCKLFADELGARIVAVGNKSAEALTLLGRHLGTNTFERVRHPSMGGANKFRGGLRALVG